LADPKFAYVASPLSLKDLDDAGGYSGASSCTLYLDPSEAVHALFASLWEKPDDDFVANVYQVQLEDIYGVWPRVSDSYNETQLKWTCWYRGKIPADVLRWVSSTKADHYVPLGKNRYPWD